MSTKRRPQKIVALARGIRRELRDKGVVIDALGRARRAGRFITITQVKRAVGVIRRAIEAPKKRRKPAPTKPKAKAKAPLAKAKPKATRELTAERRRAAALAKRIAELEAKLVATEKKAERAIKAAKKKAALPPPPPPKKRPKKKKKVAPPAPPPSPLVVAPPPAPPVVVAPPPARALTAEEQLALEEAEERAARAARVPVEPDILAQRISEMIGRPPTEEELRELRAIAVAPPALPKPKIELSDEDYTIASTYPALTHQEMLNWYRTGRLTEGAKQIIRERAVEATISNRKIDTLIKVRKSLIFEDDPQIRLMQRLLGPLDGRELMSKQDTRDILDAFFRTHETRKLEDNIEKAEREVARVTVGGSQDERAKAASNLDKARARLAEHVEGEDPTFQKYRDEINKQLVDLRPLWGEVQDALRTSDPAKVVAQLRPRYPELSTAELFALYREKVAEYLATLTPTWDEIRHALEFGDPEKIIPELKKRHPHLSIRELWSIVKSPQALGVVV